ncbi:MAG TPA: ATP-binding protein [Candidatus Thermoplasmatota archaeon]|nr:ATP-binding protein [Candidatus Thermoplasmatota archaeon]
MAPAREAAVERYVHVVATLGAAAVLASAGLLAWDTLTHGPFGVSPLHALMAVGVTGVLFLLHRFPFTFYWRDHRLVVSLDEAAILVALLAFPSPLLPICVASAVAVVQAWAGPAARIKRVFNVMQYGLAAALTTLAFVGLRAAGLPPLPAAMAACLAFGLLANLLLAGVFSRLSGERAIVVFRERFLLQGANSGAVGVSFGLAIVALWRLHPLALLAAVPLVILARRYWRLYASADRELDVHRRLASATRELVGTSSVQAVADRVLSECERLLDCGRAELVLTVDGQPASFESTFGSGPQRHVPPLVEALPARVGGSLGRLSVWPRQGKDPFGDQERALVATIAGQAASAIENARAIAEVDASRERLDTYLSTAQDAVLLVEPDGRVSYMNPAARALFGAHEGGWRAADLFADPRLLVIPDAPVLVETEARGRLLEAHAGPVHEAGRVTGALMVVRDVTERKLLEDEMVRQRGALAQSEKLSALGTMVAGVAHEINNPLTYMRGNLQMCRDSIAMRLADPGLSEEDRRFLEDVAGEVKVALDGVDRITGIAASLKNVARRGSAERKAEDLNHVVSDVVSVVRTGIPRSVRLELDLAAALPPVVASASELHQVVLNLVKNSVEALDGRADGYVRVRSYLDGEDVCVEVADNGAGIPAEVQRSLFTPFFTTKEKGTGLGLSISRGIVQAHGGQLLLASELGEGTTFTLRLPAA